MDCEHWELLLSSIPLQGGRRSLLEVDFQDLSVEHWRITTLPTLMPVLQHRPYKSMVIWVELPLWTTLLFKCFAAVRYNWKCDNKLLGSKQRRVSSKAQYRQQMGLDTTSWCLQYQLNLDQLIAKIARLIRYLPWRESIFYDRNVRLSSDELAGSITEHSNELGHCIHVYASAKQAAVLDAKTVV